MTGTELFSRALHAATSTVDVQADFPERVLAGARRRLRRRLATAVVTVTVLVGLVSAGSVAIWPPGSDPTAVRPPASDEAFIATAKDVWSDADHTGLRLRGEPRLHWAGETPAGKAAVLFQEYEAAPAASGPLPEPTVVGLVGTDAGDGQLKVLGQQEYQYGSGGFLFGPGDRTLLVVDRGRPLFVSAGPHYDVDGRLVRQWRPLPANGGVAVAQFAEAIRPMSVKVLAREPAAADRNRDGLVLLLPSSKYVASSKHVPSSKYIEPANGSPATLNLLPWDGRDAEIIRVGAHRNIDVGELRSGLLHSALEQASMTDPFATVYADGTWLVLAGLANGRTAAVSEYQSDEEPSRLYAVIFGSDRAVYDVLDGGPIEKDSLLPVRIRLPDRQGWVVAAYGASISYSVPSGASTPINDDAALLPDGTTMVGVSKAGTRPQKFQLG